MQYRCLGRTGLTISEIGIGGGALRCAGEEYARRILHRAFDLGVTYIDTASCYGDSEIKVGIAIKDRRQQTIVTTKLDAKTAAGGDKEFGQSLDRLQSDYVDVLCMHEVNTLEDLNQRLAPGGVIETLVKAKRDGKARFLGITGHRQETLAEAIRRHDEFDMVLFIMNIAEQKALEELIPVCTEKNIGMTVMKPLATGLLPANLALRFALSQPISAAVPGAASIEYVEENCAVSGTPLPLSAGEVAECERLRQELALKRCRLCYRCAPCPQNIRMGQILGTFRFYNEFRNGGADWVASYPWGDWAKENFPRDLGVNIAAIERCDDCGLCEPRCPNKLPIVSLLRGMLPKMRELQKITQGW